MYECHETSFNFWMRKPSVDSHWRIVSLFARLLDRRYLVVGTRATKMDKETGLFDVLMLVISLVVLCDGRVVKVPTGPLMHVEGQAVSIRCDVSAYEGPSDQDFDWSMVLAGDRQVNIISTIDSGFADPSMKDRVNNGEISINKLGDSSVELRFKKVRATDSGLYRCTTPSTDSVVSGNYNADVELKVIGDSLKVATTLSKSVVDEGESVQLQCSITRGFTEHTFLSVTWSVRRGNNLLEDILTFGPDDKINVGSNYTQLYADGGFQLDLRGGGFYGLVLKEPKPTEVGVYVCTAREWVRQAGGGEKWRKILERTEDVGKVVVTPLAQSLMVAVEKQTDLNMGDTLNLTCTVDAKGLPSLSLELMWLVGSIDGSGSPRVLIHIGRDGLLQNGSEAVGFSRVNARTFRLLVHKVDRSDSGFYSCHVKAWLQRGRGTWYPAAEKTSDAVQVLVTLLEPQFKVTLEAPLTPQFTSDPTELRCQVTNLLHLQDGHLGVTWSYSSTTKDVSQNEVMIASLNQHGDLITGKEYKERLERGDIAVTRRDPNIFILRVLQTRDTDMGSYLCTVTVWTSSRQGGWEKAKDVKSTSVAVQWSPKVPVLRVVAQRVREASTGGSTFEMTCDVSGQNLQNPAYSVLILFEETLGGKSRKVLSLSSESVLQLEEWSEPNRIDSVVLEKTGQLEYRFRLYGAQVSDRGFYYCRVTASISDQGKDLREVKAVNESNKIEIAFADTGLVFILSIQSHPSKVLSGDTVKMKCIMSTLSASPNTGDVAFEIHWFQSSERAVDNGGVPLISMDRWGVVKKTGGDRTQCSLERTDWQTFVLDVYKAEVKDVGEYYCIATPWFLSPATGVWTKGQDLKSSPVFLSIKIELLDSLKMPVSYGVGAAVIAGLFSVLLGLAVSHCCFSKNPLHIPRPRNKLIDLEMD